MLAQNGVHSKSSALSASQETVIQQHGARLQALVAEMIGGVLQAVQEHQPLHELERQTWARLLSMGHEVLALLFALLGPGDVGKTATLGDGRTLRRLSDLHHRPYQSPFGEFDLPRFVYGTREGQAIELVPLDERLALPAGKFSYPSDNLPLYGNQEILRDGVPGVLSLQLPDEHAVALQRAAVDKVALPARAKRLPVPSQRNSVRA